MKIKTKTNHGLKVDVNIDDFINPDESFSDKLFLLIVNTIPFLVNADNLSDSIDEFMDSRYSHLLELDHNELPINEFDMENALNNWLTYGGNEGNPYNSDNVTGYRTTILNRIYPATPTINQDTATFKAGTHFIVFKHPEVNEMKFFFIPELSTLLSVIDAPDLFRVMASVYSHDPESKVYDIEDEFEEVVFYDNDSQFQHEKLDVLKMEASTLDKVNYILDGNFLGNLGGELMVISDIIDTLKQLSISDDDICSTCTHCIYNPGVDSSCTLNYPHNPTDHEDQIVSCNEFFDVTWRN